VLKFYAPDLTIIGTGINDARYSYTVPTWTADTQALITAAKLSGDVILKTVIPSQDSTVSALEAQYAAAAQTLAATNGCGVVDINARFGDWFTADAAGYMSDTLHSTGFGYCDIAQAMFNSIKTI
jgi:hypothetical protein